MQNYNVTISVGLILSHPALEAGQVTQKLNITGGFQIHGFSARVDVINDDKQERANLD